MRSVAVRVPEKWYRIIREVAEAGNRSLGDVLAEAIESYRRALFLESANQAYERLREDETLWKHELAERVLWSNSAEERD